MKKLIGIVVLGLLWCNIGYTSPQYLVCEISKYIVRENALTDEVQRPLNEVNSTWLEKEFLTIDFDKKAILANSMELTSPIIWVWDSSEIILRYEEGDKFFNTVYDLNRITGELRVKTRHKDGMANKDTIGFEMLRFYNCEIEKKKF